MVGVTMRGIVTISRYWGYPKVNTIITDEFIGLRISLENFTKALKEEIGSVTWVVRKETFDERLDQAVMRVLEKVKQESVKIV
jgi:hypothetical protein